MWNTCLRSGGGGIIGVGLGNSFVCAHGSKIGVSKGSVGRTIVGLAGGEKYLTAMGQEYVMYDGKKPVEGQG